MGTKYTTNKQKLLKEQFINKWNDDNDSIAMTDFPYRKGEIYLKYCINNYFHYELKLHKYFLCSLYSLCVTLDFTTFLITRLYSICVNQNKFEKNQQLFTEYFAFIILLKVWKQGPVSQYTVLYSYEENLHLFHLYFEFCIYFNFLCVLVLTCIKCIDNVPVRFLFSVILFVFVKFFVMDISFINTFSSSL